MEIASLLGIWVHPDDQTSLLQPLLDLAQPTPGHSRLADFDGFDNLGVRAPGTRGTLAGREQDPGIRPGAGGCAWPGERLQRRQAHTPGCGRVRGQQRAGGATPRRPRGSTSRHPSLLADAPRPPAAPAIPRMAG